MGSSSFKHNFIIFESLKNEILIGNDFFLAHKIAIYPSIGLLYESSNIFKVDILPQQTFEVLITDDISLLPHTHRVVSFKVNMDMTDTDLPLVLNKYMLVSSEKIYLLIHCIFAINMYILMLT